MGHRGINGETGIDVCALTCKTDGWREAATELGELVWSSVVT